MDEGSSRLTAVTGGGDAIEFGAGMLSNLCEELGYPSGFDVGSDGGKW